MNNVVPNEWEIVPLGELCLGVRGVSYKPDDLSPVKTKQTVTLLRSNNIQSGQLFLADVQNVNQTKVSEKQLACKGDIAVCMSNGSKRLVGKSAVFRNIPHGTKFTIGAFCSIFRPLEPVSSGFLAQLLSSDQFQHQVDFSLAGSAINNLKNSDVIEYQFLKPPLPEQKKIAAILSSVDEVIEKTRAQIDKLKNLKTGMMQELLTKGIGPGGVPHTELKDSPVGRIPAGWEVSSLNQLVTIKHGYAFEGAYFRSVPTPYLLLTPGNFNKDGRLYFGPKTKYYDGPVPEDFILKNGDVLVVMTDLTKEMTILGNTIILKSPNTVLHNQRIGKVVSLKENILLPDYLCMIMNSDRVKSHIKDTATGTTVRHTSPTKILEPLIPIPPISEQAKIADIFRALNDKVALVESKLAAHEIIKKALMQDLLTGKVRVNVEARELADA